MPFRQLANGLGNVRWLRRIRRAVTRVTGIPVMASDVRDIGYASWVVPLRLVAHLVPRGVTLHVRDGKTILTVLTYRHGHFGPAFLGPLRRIFPSPLQSNWRLYLHVPPEREGDEQDHNVLFLRNLFDSALYALGTRIVTDVMASQHARPFLHRREGARLTTQLDNRDGAALALEMAAAPPELPPEFETFFAGWDKAVAWLTLQDAAIAKVSDEDRLSISAIDLPIDPATIVPQRAAHFVPGELLTRWGATGAPFCFFVPEVHFRALSDRLLPRD